MAKFVIDYFSRSPGARQGAPTKRVSRYFTTRAMAEAYLAYLEKQGFAGTVRADDRTTQAAATEAMLDIARTRGATPQAAPRPGPERRPEVRPRATVVTPDDANRVRALLIQAGAKVDDPQIQYLLSRRDSVDILLNSPAQIEELAHQHPDPALAAGLKWQDQLAQWHLPERAYDQARPKIIDQKYLGGRPRQPDQYYTQSDTGAAIFGDGTVVDPDGKVIFGPGSTAIGSQAWRAQATSMSPSEVLRWKRKLDQLNYDVGDVKDGTLTPQFLAAMSAYGQAHYQNFGNDLPLELGGTGAKQKPYDFNTDKAAIATDVRGLFMDTFGRQPSAAEADRWTQVVIQAARKVSTTSPAGESPAMAQVREQFMRMPGQEYARGVQGEAVGEVAKENTALRDRFVSAAQAVSGTLR